MKKYKILTKGMFQKMSTFEDMLNSEFKNGWVTKTVAINPSGQLIALLERAETYKEY
ncbi:MAG: hypothetical protein GY751_07520 [Bacteroidetes bacterium]|nr:hypothetical protein [Bacteroidota bacterium]